MKIYKVAVTEIYRKVVSVKAINERDARQRTRDAWMNTEIILDMNDFEGAEMHVLDDGKEIDGEIFSDKSVIDFYEDKQEHDDGRGKGTAKNGR